jgi:hypothetical protein
MHAPSMATSNGAPFAPTPARDTSASPRLSSLETMRGKWDLTAAAEKQGAVARRTARHRGVSPAAVKMEGVDPPHTPSMTPYAGRHLGKGTAAAVAVVVVAFPSPPLPPLPRAPTAVASDAGSATTTARDPATPRMVKMGPNASAHVHRRRWKSGASMSAVCPVSQPAPPGAQGRRARSARRRRTRARARAADVRAADARMAARAVRMRVGSAIF